LVGATCGTIGNEAGILSVGSVVEGVVAVAGAKFAIQGANFRIPSCGLKVDVYTVGRIALQGTAQGIAVYTQTVDSISEKVSKAHVTLESSLVESDQKENSRKRTLQCALSCFESFWLSKVTFTR